MATLFLVFWGTSILFSMVAAPTYIPTNSVEGFPFLHTLSTICFCWHFNDSHSDWYEVVPHCICISLIISNDGHIFMCLLVICLSSLEKCLFRFSAYFLIEFVFLILSCVSCLYILEIKLLSVSLVAIILSYSEGCLHFVYSFLGLSWWVSGKNPPANAGDGSSIPGLRRSPGEGNGNPLQYSCLELPLERGP